MMVEMVIQLQVVLVEVVEAVLVLSEVMHQEIGVVVMVEMVYLIL